MRLVISDRDVIEARKYKESYEFKTDLNFLKQHKGFKRQSLHTFVGKSGKGKTTIIRTLILDFLKNNPEKNIFLWISEETAEDLKREMMDYKDIFFNKDSRLYIEVEKKGQEEKSEYFFKRMYEAVTVERCDLILFDNITTSSVYKGNPSYQENVTEDLKQFVIDMNVSMVVIAHTKKSMNQHSLITAEDVNGSQELIKITPYLYILQMFEIGNSKKQTLHVEKCRAFDIINSFYHLPYCKQTRCYEGDGPIEFEVIRQWFRTRNKL